MKPSQRRSSNSYPYYKLATFDPRSFAFRDGSVAYPSAQEASRAASAKGKGRYRISEVTENGRQDREPFEIN